MCWHRSRQGYRASATTRPRACHEAVVPLLLLVRFPVQFSRCRVPNDRLITLFDCKPGAQGELRCPIQCSGKQKGRTRRKDENDLLARPGLDDDNSQTRQFSTSDGRDRNDKRIPRRDNSKARRTSSLRVFVCCAQGLRRNLRFRDEFLLVDLLLSGRRLR